MNKCVFARRQQEQKYFPGYYGYDAALIDKKLSYICATLNE